MKRGLLTVSERKYGLSDERNKRQIKTSVIGVHYYDSIGVF